VKLTNVFPILLAVWTILSLSGCGQAELPSISAPASAPPSQPSGSASPSGQPSASATPSPADYGPAFATAKAQYAIHLEMTRIAQVTAAAAVPTAPPVTDTPAPVGSPYQPPLGISDRSHLGVHPCDCAFLNSWGGEQNGWYLAVYAGNWERDPDQGLLMTINQTIDGHTTTGDLFSTPTREGAVRIVSATGLQLTLRSTNGTQYIFDAGTDTWIYPPVTPTTVPTMLPTTSPTVLSTMLPKASP
jgi:hypothetical protein